MINDPPIQDLESVDIVAPRVNGIVELYIVASGPLDASPQTQKLLLDKVQNYLEMIASPDFQAEFNNPPSERVHIIVACEFRVDPVIRLLVERSKQWVAQNGARIRLESDSATPGMQP